MKTKICMTVLSVCLVTASEVAAQNYCEIERLRIRSQGEGVSADFSSLDTSTCPLGIETTVHVEGSQGVISQADICGGGGLHMGSVSPTQTNVAAVLVGVYDRCLGAQVLSVTGTGEAEELHVSQNFKTASLRATIEGLDAFDQPISVAIELVWTGVGQKERTATHESDNQGIFRFHYSSSGTIRDAVASGSVVVNGRDETPLPSSQGTIERSVLHALDVWR